MTKTMTRKKAPEKKRTPFRAPMKKPRFPKPRDPNPLTAQIKAAEGDFQGAFAAIDRADTRSPSLAELPFTVTMPVWGRGAKWSA